MMFSEKIKNDVIDIVKTFKLRTEYQKQCMMRLNEQLIEKVDEFKHYCFILYKHGSTGGETTQTALQGRKVAGSVACMTRGRTASMNAGKGTLR